MQTSLCLVTCALMLAQTGDRAEWQLSPQLASGTELLYRGELLEEDLGPQFQRQTRYRLDATLLVLEAGVKDWQVAFLTTLTRIDAKEPMSKPDNDGKRPPAKTAAEMPASLRIELAKVETQGRVRNKDGRLVQIPLKGIPTLESGFFVAVPLTKVGRNYTWDAPEEGRTPLRWQVVGTESSGGILCIKLVGVQQSEDWEQGRADHVAWRRRDTIWLHPQFHVAQRVERIIERREPARQHPTERVTVRYELESPLKYPSIVFNERRQEILKAADFYDTTQALIQDPTRNRATMDAQITRIAHFVDRGRDLAYRPVFAHLVSTLENAKKAEAPVPLGQEESAPLPTLRGIGVGHRAPDFLISAFTQEEPTRFQAKSEKPTLVFFYSPTSTMTREILMYARQLSQRKGTPVRVLAFAVAPDAELVRKQHQEFRLNIPIHDGNGMRLTFGVEQTPRFVVIDREGLITFTQTGWGLHTPFELDDVFERCQKK